MIWAQAVLLPIHIAMMLGFEIPDLEADAATGKRVLAVRLGEPWTVRLIEALLVVSGAMLLASTTIGSLPDASNWTWLAVVPALLFVAGTRTGRYTISTAGAASTLVVAGAALVAALAA
jgi:1,4-dihydroxy-2-naphthoate octaprenyltransferase